MKNSFKMQLSKALSGNVELNKKAVLVKRSWDEVAGLITKGKQKPKN
ncbi:hypothetical protein [Anaerocolumna sp. MB42-C2]|nr:hypothetical protein [Anaerocolumna sp. MB42-C2]WMJ85385.1 hypothetical protein RBU59_14975 [Anaerocolumna sp. MB42-C2]